MKKVMKQRVAESKEEFNQAKLRFEAARSSGKPTSKSNKVFFPFTFFLLILL